MGASAQNCATKATDKADVATTIRAMYAAAVVDDLAKFNALIVPGFYMYDGGKRFDGDEIMQLIKSAHAQGTVYVWTVNDPDVHVSCNEAWIAYVNRGSVKMGAAAPISVEWLESAVLQREKDGWKIAFFHIRLRLHRLSNQHAVAIAEEAVSCCSPRGRKRGQDGFSAGKGGTST